MTTDELKKLVETANSKDYSAAKHQARYELLTKADYLAREVIALREAAEEVIETHMLTGGGSPEAWAKHCAALTTLRAVLGESE
jgi:hypothetical protein